MGGLTFIGGLDSTPLKDMPSMLALEGDGWAFTGRDYGPTPPIHALPTPRPQYDPAWIWQPIRIETGTL